MPPNTRLAVFDAVTSNTALVLPVAQLVALCRDRWVCVSGWRSKGRSESEVCWLCWLLCMS
jgi:hypothetical protein